MRSSTVENDPQVTSGYDALGVVGPDTPSGDFLALLTLLAPYRRLLWGIGFWAVVVSTVVAFLLPNHYKATARVLPAQPSSSQAFSALNQLSGLMALAGKDLGVKNPSDLYSGVLKSRGIADQLIQKFELQKVYRDRRMVDTREDLADNTEIAVGKDSIISITVEDKDPNRAAEMANAYVDELKKTMSRLTVTDAGQRRIFFEKQVDIAREKLSQAEVELRKTQEATGLIHLNEQARAIIETAARIRAQISAREIQLARLRGYATDENPDVIMTERELAGLRTQLQQAEQSQSGGEGSIYIATAKIPKAGMEYVRRFRDVKEQEAIYQELKKQYMIAYIDEAKDAPAVQVVDSGVAPDKKSRPVRSLIILGSLLGALIVTIGVIVILEKIQSFSPNESYRERLLFLQQVQLWPIRSSASGRPATSPPSHNG